MHALPEKLTALRHEVEDGVRRQFLEHEAKSERRIQEASERAEEAAVRRLRELFEPTLIALSGSKEEGKPVVPLDERLGEISTRFWKQTGALKQELEAWKDEANKRFIDIRADMAPLTAAVHKSSGSLHELGAGQKELRESLSSLGKDLAASSEGLRKRLEEEVQRAEGHEASIRSSIRDLLDSLTKAQRELADHADQAAVHAARHAAEQAHQVEGRLWRRLEDHGREVASQAAGAKAAEAAEKVDRQLEEHRSTVEAHAAQLQAKLEEECHAVAAGMTAAAELAASRAAAERHEQHAGETSRHLEQVRHELDGRCRDMLTEMRMNYHGALDWHAAVGAQSDSLRAAVRRAEEHADEVAKAAEQRAADEAERRMKEALAEVRRELEAERGESQRREEAAREDIGERLRLCLRDCQQHCETAAQRHEATARELSARLLLAPPAAVGGLQAGGLGTSSLSIGGPITGGLAADGLGGAVDGVGRVGTGAGDPEMEYDAEYPIDTKPPRRLGDRFFEATESVREEVHRLQEGTGLEVSLLRSEIADRVTRQEACESAVAAATVTGEALGRIAALEAALTRQRQRIDSAVQDLSARCDACRADSLDARVKSQQELHHLGAELAKYQAAGASLVQGVCQALQVLGLLGEGVGVEPHQVPTGDPASVARCPRGGVGLLDLLEWEAGGQSLAVRVARQWSAVAPEPWPANLVELLQTKADHRDLLALRSSLRLWSPTPPAGGPTGPALALAAAAQAVPMPAARDRAEAALAGLQGKVALQPQPPCTPRGPLAPLTPLRRCGEVPRAA